MESLILTSAENAISEKFTIMVISEFEFDWIRSNGDLSMAPFSFKLCLFSYIGISDERNENQNAV